MTRLATLRRWAADALAALGAAHGSPCAPAYSRTEPDQGTVTIPLPLARGLRDVLADDGYPELAKLIGQHIVDAETRLADR